MVRELAKPFTLLAIILCLLALFHAAFLEPATSTLQHIEDVLGPLLLAAATALLGGLAFRSVRQTSPPTLCTLWSTLPLRVFYWGVAGMAVLFLAAWYFETCFIPYGQLR